MADPIRILKNGYTRTTPYLVFFEFLSFLSETRLRIEDIHGSDPSRSSSNTAWKQQKPPTKHDPPLMHNSNSHNTPPRRHRKDPWAIGPKPPCVGNCVKKNEMGTRKRKERKRKRQFPVALKSMEMTAMVGNVGIWGMVAHKGKTQLTLSTQKFTRKCLT